MFYIADKSMVLIILETSQKRVSFIWVGYKNKSTLIYKLL
ncbi:hypothetical protein UF66_0821 [Staphylococcus cohnii subsp. cohnii]|uniref:Uncharacterized protein n=1 Tax=Staphylococcus cohnii subsp. cohnii TaxID=74704 RepID=A0A0M2NY08_STACC|nr:hypothetical protein UF66_0821 [Staphylococcus cohnii subsp. cohnii]